MYTVRLEVPVHVASTAVRMRGNIIIDIPLCCILRGPEDWTWFIAARIMKWRQILFSKIQFQFRASNSFSLLTYRMQDVYALGNIKSNCSRVNERINTTPSPPVCPVTPSLHKASPPPPVNRPGHAILAVACGKTRQATVTPLTTNLSPTPLSLHYGHSSLSYTRLSRSRRLQLLWDPKVSYPVLETPPFGSVYVNPLHNITTFFFKININIICQPVLRSAR